MRQILSLAPVYEAFQTLVGARAARRRLIRDLIQPSHGQRLLDIGCGPGGLLAELDTSIQYTGVDGDRDYIAAARERYGARGEFIEGLIDANWRPTLPGGFDRIVAFGILHHLDDGSVRALLTNAHRLLAPGGRFVSLDPAFVPNQSPVARAMIRCDRGEFVRDEARYRALAAGVFGQIKGEMHHDLLRVPYTHFTMCGQRSL
jgi:SAM-dependent methyltransferase